MQVRGYYRNQLLIYIYVHIYIYSSHLTFIYIFLNQILNVALGYILESLQTKSRMKKSMNAWDFLLLFIKTPTMIGEKSNFDSTNVRLLWTDPPDMLTVSRLLSTKSCPVWSRVGVCVDVVVVVVVVGLQMLTSCLAWLLKQTGQTCSHRQGSSLRLYLRWDVFTLSLMLSALSGSPPPPRFLNSVMFGSFRDDNVSHKPTPEQRGSEGGTRGGNPAAFPPVPINWRFILAWFSLFFLSERSAGVVVGQVPSKSVVGSREPRQIGCVCLCITAVGPRPPPLSHNTALPARLQNKILIQFSLF